MKMLFTVLLAAQILHAGNEVYFGPEFTFTNDAVVKAQRRNPVASDGAEWMNSPVSDGYVTQWKRAIAEQLRTNCPACRIVGEAEYGGAARNIEFRVLYPDGWWYEVTTDPAAVEVKAKPATSQQTASLASRMQRDIFDLARSISLMPHQYLGNGHVNISFTAFRQNPLLLRNFIVDYQNHPTLAIASLGNDPYNAPPIGLLSALARRTFASVIRQFDGFGARSNFDLSLWLVTNIQEQVYTEAWQPHESVPGNWRRKFQAVNMTTISPAIPEQSCRIEIRGHRPQRSANEWLLLVTLYDAKIKSLQRLRAPIALKSEQELEVSVEIGARGRVRLTDRNPARARQELQSYVEGAGLASDAYLQTFL